MTAPQRMCPSQQDGIFYRGEEPEHLSLQHLSILFCLPHNKTRASAAKYSQEQRELQTDRAGQEAAGVQVGQSRKRLFGYIRICLCCGLSGIMTSYNKVRQSDTMSTAAPEVS